MSIEHNVLSNIDYSITNYSNYDITKDETQDILDVPYFPAQNLVDFSDELNLFKKTNSLTHFIPFKDTSGNNPEYVLYGLVNRNDARVVFVEYRSWKRSLVYNFSGINYPQGRNNYAITYDGNRYLYLFGGETNGRGMNDLWVFDFVNKEWNLLNFDIYEKSANQQPSKRRKSSICVFSDKVYIFGGETDTLIDNQWIPLNDIWEFNLLTKEFKQYDKHRKLPRVEGNIVYVSSNEIIILTKPYTDELGNPQPIRLWIVNTTNDNVSHINISNLPFIPSYNNITLFRNGQFYLLIPDGRLFRFNKNNNTFTLVRNGVNAVKDDLGYYSVEERNIRSGNHNLLPEVRCVIPKEYNNNGNIISEYIQYPPPIMYLPQYINFKDNNNNNKVFFYGGMLNQTELNEVVFIYDSEKNTTIKLSFPEDRRPQERIYTSLAYDKQRNRIWLFGGYDGSTYYNDLWYFDLNTQEWIKIHNNVNNQNDNNPSVPQPRHKSGICVVLDYLYILGGYSDIKAFADLWKFNINEGEWSRELTIDTIPFGTQYYIFEYKDRLWMFNGDLSGLYRYYYSKKEFVKQPTLRGFVRKQLSEFIASKSFLNPPIQVQFLNNKLFIYSSDFKQLIVNVETRELIDLSKEFENITGNVLWLSDISGILLDKDKTSLYYLNYAEAQPLTKNQLPSSFFTYSIRDGLSRGFFLKDVEISDFENGTLFLDKSGYFKLHDEYEYLDKRKLYQNQQFSFVGLQSQFPEYNLNDNNVITNLTNEKLLDPTIVPITYWFLYNAHSNTFKLTKGAIKVLKREKDLDGKFYIIYENGNIVRFNKRDDTFFTYYTQLWRGSAIGYDRKNDVIYCFGGLIDATVNENGTVNILNRKPYLQNGMQFIPKSQTCRPFGYKYQASHSGFMYYDLKLNEFSLNGIINFVRRNNIEVVEYDVIKDYLLDIANDYFDTYGSSLSPEVEEMIRGKIYLRTREILDDLSQLNKTYENGTRPYARAYMLNVDTGNSLYIFGGAEVIRGDCCNVNNNIGICRRIGSYSLNNATPQDIDDLSKSAYVFNYETQTWRRLANLPFWLYMGSAIYDEKRNKIILVGGAKGEDLQNLNKDIIIYDINQNSYELLRGIPREYKGRLNPILHWIDEDRLLIMYGTEAIKKDKECDGGGKNIVYLIFPVRDAWIIDFSKNVMYRAFEDYFVQNSIVVNDFSTNVKNQRKMYVLNAFPLKVNNDFSIKLYEYNLTNGSVISHSIIPDNEILLDFAYLNPNNTLNNLNISGTNFDISNVFDDIESNVNEDDTYKTILKTLIEKDINFRFRYAWIEKDYVNNKRYMFIVGERSQDSGIQFIKEMSNGYKEAHLRFWWIDIDDEKRLHQIVYNYPLAVSPKCVVYDGFRYLYFIWNKHNIWRLDFKGVLQNPDGSHWFRLPPCHNCNFLGNTNTDVKLDGFFIPPKYLAIVNKDGLFAKMDVLTYAWFIHKESLENIQKLKEREERSKNDKRPIKYVNIVDKQDYELYITGLGTIEGKVMNLYYSQWDNFYLDLRLFSETLNYFGEYIDKSIYPLAIFRKRAYFFNHLGHIYYTWIKIDGRFSVEYDMERFYDGKEIRIYGDDEILNQNQRIDIEYYSMNGGWKKITDKSIYQVIRNETDWQWDGEYTRRYIRIVSLPSGGYGKQYTKVPNNYVKIPIPQNDIPISSIKVSFVPERRDRNYIARINRIDFVDVDNEVIFIRSMNDDTQVFSIHLEPITTNDQYTQVYIATIKNVSNKVIRNVEVYITGNKEFQFSLDENNWNISDEKNPLLVASTLGINGKAQFYIRGINIDNKPKLKKIVVRCIIPLT